MADEKPGDWSADATLRKEYYFTRHLDGAQAPEEAAFDPELQNRLTQLYIRQRNDACDLLDKATGRLQYDLMPYELPDDHPEKRAPDEHRIEILKAHKEEFLGDYHRECERFAEERDRRIREHYKAKAILAEMKEQSRQEELRHDDPDEPHLTR
jgi:hypothetical protein